MPRDAPRGAHAPNKKPYSRPADSNGRLPRQDGPSPHARSDRPAGGKDERRGPRGPATVGQKSTEKAAAKNKPQAEQLDLSNQQLVSPPSLAAYSALTRLNLTNCGLTSIDFVKQAAATLSWLNVSGNDLSSPDAWNGVEELRTLFVLNASHCNLTAVPPCIARLSTLKALVLSHNSLTRLEHVANLPDLNTIVVSNNSLTSLPASLATLPSMKKISAAHNRLTPTGLPDLCSLSHLHELRLNDNRSLTSLPSHFGAWGKGETGKGGLEILDLGNCGFESWFGLKELAKQEGIVNLGLKGNKVAEDAVNATGFDEFKAKLTILLPSLRILDTHRFDAKYFDLKAQRALRTEEQKILDAGPMALALNAKKGKPVEISESVVKERERERENRRRKRKGIVEEVGAGRSKKRRVESVEAGDGRVEGAEVDEVAVADKEMATATTDAEPSKPKKPKKRSNAERKALARARAAGEAGTTAPALEEIAIVEDEADSGAAAMPETSSGKKGKKGRLLDALRGDGTDVAAKPSTGRSAPTSAPAPAAPAAAAPEEKQKTSVAKIIEVRRPGDGGKKKQRKKGGKMGGSETQKVDVDSLLGLASVKEQEEKADEAGKRGVAALGSGLGGGWELTGAGTGLFGGGGWN
ncbi:leucine rich repeat domain containing protein [Rhodotorula toruloides]|uniref:Leucine rich repeat domain containing protein n=1 Tax=Rhodotorula toruloides TaxID=5286 RepID=A0A511KEA6_RHOTO|nr:leucine rich repeat domain containing protein [Rhodotorula toruloides]